MRVVTLPNVVIAGLVLGTATLFALGPAPRQAVAPEALPPTPAALATRAAEAERAARAEAEQRAAAARAEAQRRQSAAAQAIQASAEEETVLPEGTGRGETFAYCTPCHNTAIIRRSRFTRAQWDGLMDWMTERHGMNPLEGEFRTLIVDYLATQFGPAEGSAPRARNPFLN